MKKYIIFLGLLLLAFNSYSQESREQLFDFWVGEWNVSWVNSQGYRGYGENTIHKILNGEVIQENFKVLEDTTMSGFEGKSWSIYSENSNTWHQTWVDNSGGHFSFTGGIEGGVPYFREVKELENGSTVILQMDFKNIQKNSLTWIWKKSDDNGETWTELWKIDYERKETE